MADKQQFSHRNGEYDKPTIEGLYWLREDNDGGSVVMVSWQEEMPAEDGFEGYPARFEIWVIGSEVEVYFDQLSDDAQWWGPVTPPWETDNGR